MNKKMVCVWQEEEDLHETFWITDCGQAFAFTEGAKPADNDFAFCPYCGKVLNGKQIDLGNLEVIRKLAKELRDE